MPTLACKCGNRLTVEASRAGARCPACGAELPPSDAVEPHAPRDVAAGRPVPSQTGELLPETPDIVFACRNPYCQELLSASARNAGRKWRCAVCRCPLVIPSQKERTGAAPAPIHHLTLPAVELAGPVRLVQPNRFHLGKAILAGGLGFLVAVCVLVYIGLLTQDLPSVRRSCYFVVVGIFLGMVVYWACRRHHVRIGQLDQFTQFQQAVVGKDLAVLIEGLRQKQRGAEVAACRAMIDLGEDAAAAVPALVDLLWGAVPLEKNWPPAGPPRYDCCLVCGKRLNIWSNLRTCSACPSEMSPAWDAGDYLPVRGWAARALASIGPAAAAARPALEAVHHLDRVPLVREEAGIALTAIHG